MAAAQAFNQTDVVLDDQLVDETFYGTHCHPDSHIAQFGLNRHEACVGWWPSDIAKDQAVGFRCACACHDMARPAP